MNYIITGNTYNSKFIDEIAKDPRVIAMSGEELEKSDIHFSSEDKVYVPSETSLSIVMDRIDSQEYVDGINKLKNKYFCREVIQPMYPDFYFSKATIEEIPTLDLKGKKVVIKPLKGFFGTGVRFADETTDMKELARSMKSEVDESAKFFPESILTKNEYIIEEMITGDEYAVDMFFDSNGEPSITNIYFHPDPLIADYFHLMYYTNKDIFEEYTSTFITFFKNLNKIMKLKGFPIHAEFKNQNGVMVPIELNPMRYGGFGLSDLTFNSFGYQPISGYFFDEKADWTKIWSERETNHYAWILGYNGNKINVKESEPKHGEYKDFLQEYCTTIDYVTLNHLENPVFSLAYVVNKDLNKMKELLNTDFNRFFTSK